MRLCLRSYLPLLQRPQESPQVWICPLCLQVSRASRPQLHHSSLRAPSEPNEAPLLYMTVINLVF